MFHLTTALDPGAQVPLYEQLYRSLTAELRAGAVPAGTRMPGKRSLAAELSVSINTVDTAYPAADGGRLPGKPPPKRILCAAKPLSAAFAGAGAGAASPGSSGTAGCSWICPPAGWIPGCSRHGPGRGCKRSCCIPARSCWAPGMPKGTRSCGRRWQSIWPNTGVCGAAPIRSWWGQGWSICWGCWPRCCPARRQWKRPATRGPSRCWKTTGCPAVACRWIGRGCRCRRWRTPVRRCVM